MSDISDLEKTCLKQKEQLTALKAEIEKFEKGEVSEEYIDETWQRLKSENRVTSPTLSPQNKIDSSHPATINSDDLTIIEMSQFARGDINTSEKTAESTNDDEKTPEDPQISPEDKNIPESMEVEEPQNDITPQESPQPEEVVESPKEEAQIETDQTEQVVIPEESEIMEEINNTKVEQETEIPQENGFEEALQENGVEQISPETDLKVTPDIEMTEEATEEETKSSKESLEETKESKNDEELSSKASSETEGNLTPLEESKRSRRLSNRWGMKSIMSIWDFLSNHKFGTLFMHKVTHDMAPDYATTVLKSMDLSQLRRRIENGEVEGPLDFQHSVMLTFTNALMFNSMDDDVYKYTLEIFDDYLAEQRKYNDLEFVHFDEAVPVSSKRRLSSRVSPPSKKRRT